MWVLTPKSETAEEISELHRSFDKLPRAPVRRDASGRYPPGSGQSICSRAAATESSGRIAHKDARALLRSGAVRRKANPQISVCFLGKEHSPAQRPLDCSWRLTLAARYPTSVRRPHAAFAAAIRGGSSQIRCARVRKPLRLRCHSDIPEIADRPYNQPLPFSRADVWESNSHVRAGPCQRRTQQTLQHRQSYSR